MNKYSLISISGQRFIIYSNRSKEETLDDVLKETYFKCSSTGDIVRTIFIESITSMGIE